MKLEIQYTCRSVPFMAIPTILLFILEVRGYSKLYDNINDTRFGKNEFVYPLALWVKQTFG